MRTRLDCHVRRMNAFAALASEGREGGAGCLDHDCLDVNEEGTLGRKDSGALGVKEGGVLREKVEQNPKSGFCSVCAMAGYR